MARNHSNSLFFMMVFLPSLFFISQIVKALSEDADKAQRPIERNGAVDKAQRWRDKAIHVE